MTAGGPTRRRWCTGSLATFCERVGGWGRPDGAAGTRGKGQLRSVARSVDARIDAAARSPPCAVPSLRYRPATVPCAPGELEGLAPAAGRGLALGIPQGTARTGARPGPYVDRRLLAVSPCSSPRRKPRRCEMDPLDLLEELGSVDDPPIRTCSSGAAARCLTASAGQRKGAGLRARIPGYRRLAWLAATTAAAAATAIAFSVTPTPRPAGVSAETPSHTVSLTDAILPAAFDIHAGDIVEISKQVTGGGAARRANPDMAVPRASDTRPRTALSEADLRLRIGKPTNDVRIHYDAPASSKFVPSQDSCAMFTVPATSGQHPIGGPETLVTAGLPGSLPAEAVVDCRMS